MNNIIESKITHMDSVKYAQENGVNFDEHINTIKIFGILSICFTTSYIILKFLEYIYCFSITIYILQISLSRFQISHIQQFKDLFLG